eukprot:13026018-Ditylum_brightwellii.AAC.1
MHGQNNTHDTDNCFEINRHKKCTKSETSRSGKDKVSYKDLNAFVSAKVLATLNKAKKKQKKEKEVEINAFNKFRFLNVESSNKEGELKASTTTADIDSESKASCLLSNASNSKGSIECNM